MRGSGGGGVDLALWGRGQTHSCIMMGCHEAISDRGMTRGDATRVSTY